MKRGKLGFTLIEVAIFLAITGALFVSVAVGVQNSVYQQRTNDSVQSFMEFLRTAYAGVTDVQNTGGGRSDKAIYGRLITFGETHNLAGEPVENDNGEIFMYTIIGDINEDKTGEVMTVLKDLNAGLIRKTTKENGAEEVLLAGIAENYTPKWAAEIEPACDTKLSDCDFTPMKGMIMIVRHPNSGTVSTFYSPQVIEVNDLVRQMNAGGNVNIDLFNSELGFQQAQIDFCMDTTGGEKITNRADIRIIKGAKNASGIELVANDVEGYRCGK